MTLEKGYDNALKWEFDVNHKKASDQLIADAGLYEEEQKELSSVTTVCGLIKALSGVDNPSPRQSAFLANLQKKFPGGSLTSAIYSILKIYLPYFVWELYTCVTLVLKRKPV